MKMPFKNTRIYATHVLAKVYTINTMHGRIQSLETVPLNCSGNRCGSLWRTCTRRSQQFACNRRPLGYNLYATGRQLQANFAQASSQYSAKPPHFGKPEQLFEWKNKDAIKNQRIYTTHVLAKVYPINTMHGQIQSRFIIPLNCLGNRCGSLWRTCTRRSRPWRRRTGSRSSRRRRRSDTEQNSRGQLFPLFKHIIYYDSLT